MLPCTDNFEDQLSHETWPSTVCVGMNLSLNSNENVIKIH